MNPTPQYLALQKFIQEKIAPGILAHGGYVDIVDLQDNVVTIELSGACGSCSVQAFTSESLTNYILDEFPELEDVIVKDVSS